MENLEKVLSEYIKEKNLILNELEDLKKQLEVKDAKVKQLEKNLEVKNEIITGLLDSYRNSIRFK